ncbi:MAG: hypothetical protein VYE73_10445, partial [Acidobacteriota bacterium]|nr:hypothetical protein [Acidobacteriota bacterium]
TALTGPLGEFGCSRESVGAARYLADVMDAATARMWHWAFYAFREDTWSQMGYELGAAPLDATTLDRIRSGELPRSQVREDLLWRALQSRIQDGLLGSKRPQ